MWQSYGRVQYPFVREHVEIMGPLSTNKSTIGGLFIKSQAQQQHISVQSVRRLFQNWLVAVIHLHIRIQETLKRFNYL